jgi:hypothetical protein
MNIFSRAFARAPENFNLDLQNEARWLTESAKYSPDLGFLEQFEFQILFSADDTKLGHLRHCLIEESALLSTGYTRKNFRFWEQRVGEGDKQERIPIPIIDHSEAKPLDFGQLNKFPQPMKIQGELHLMRPHQFRELDNYKQNGVQFLRKRIDVIVPHREVIIKDYFDVDGRELPRCLQGKQGVHGPEVVYMIRAWMYVADPSYWNDLVDGGFNGFRPVFSVQSGNPVRKGWLPSYYAYPRDKEKDLKGGG